MRTASVVQSHNQMQAVVQEGLIANAPQKIRRPHSIRLAEVFEVVEMEHDAPGSLGHGVAQESAQNAWAIQQERACGHPA